jgi:hypothetical protein
LEYKSLIYTLSSAFSAVGKIRKYQNAGKGIIKKLEGFLSILYILHIAKKEKRHRIINFSHSKKIAIAWSIAASGCFSQEFSRA